MMQMDGKGYCIFRWEEIKQIGSKFIYIYLPPPFSDYYSYYNRMTKISTIEEGKGRGPSALGIVGIVLGCIGIISLIISIILYYRICTKKNRFNSDNNSPAPMIPDVKEVEETYNNTPVITQVKPVDKIVYDPPTEPYSNPIN